MIVEDGKITSAKFLSGDVKRVEMRNKQLSEDPATGIIGELGFGTQLLPFSGKRHSRRENLLGLVMWQQAAAIIWVET